MNNIFVAAMKQYWNFPQSANRQPILFLLHPHLLQSHNFVRFRVPGAICNTLKSPRKRKKCYLQTMPYVPSPIRFNFSKSDTNRQRPIWNSVKQVYQTLFHIYQILFRDFHLFAGHKWSEDAFMSYGHFRVKWLLWNFTIFNIVWHWNIKNQMQFVINDKLKLNYLKAPSTS